jgi:hypothetical protein
MKTYCKNCNKIIDSEDYRRKYCENDDICFKEYYRKTFRKHNSIRDLNSNCCYLGCNGLGVSIINNNLYCKPHFNKLRYNTINKKRRGRKKLIKV